MDRKALSDIARKKRVFAYAEEIGNIAKACRYFGISRETFYDWKKRYTAKGDAGLVNSKPCPQNPTLRVAKPIEEKILYLRGKYHFGPARIAWSLDRYFGMKVSPTGVYHVLKRNGMNVLPKGKRTRSVKSFKRYEKRVPGHRVQIDVKFLTFHKEGHKIRRYQFTAIDDATRARVLRGRPQFQLAIGRPQRGAVLRLQRDMGQQRCLVLRLQRLGGALQRRGIGRNDTVAVMLPNTPAMVEAHFGIPMAGAVLNTLNTRLDAPTLAFMLDHGEAKAVFVDAEYAALMAEAIKLR